MFAGFAFVLFWLIQCLGLRVDDPGALDDGFPARACRVPFHYSMEVNHVV